ncbi:hypothetical protein VTL71DRAFT_4312 [Oculimacula yallundae]|uniref:Uncharacterized protein n=1 Tax=Oculimacula yallundae TaxID=86028 RepID=A0ABR4C5G6_9HELO
MSDLRGIDFNSQIKLQLIAEVLSERYEQVKGLPFFFDAYLKYEQDNVVSWLRVNELAVNQVSVRLLSLQFLHKDLVKDDASLKGKFPLRFRLKTPKACQAIADGDLKLFPVRLRHREEALLVEAALKISQPPMPSPIMIARTIRSNQPYPSHTSKELITNHLPLYNSLISQNVHIGTIFHYQQEDFKSGLPKISPVAYLNSPLPGELITRYISYAHVANSIDLPISYPSGSMKPMYSSNDLAMPYFCPEGFREPFNSKTLSVHMVDKYISANWNNFMDVLDPETGLPVDSQILSMQASNPNVVGYDWGFWNDFVTRIPQEIEVAYCNLNGFDRMQPCNTGVAMIIAYRIKLGIQHLTSHQRLLMLRAFGMGLLSYSDSFWMIDRAAAFRGSSPPPINEFYIENEYFFSVDALPLHMRFFSPASKPDWRSQVATPAAPPQSRSSQVSHSATFQISFRPPPTSHTSSEPMGALSHNHQSQSQIQSQLQQTPVAQLELQSQASGPSPSHLEAQRSQIESQYAEDLRGRFAALTPVLQSHYLTHWILTGGLPPRPPPPPSI